MKGVFPKGNIPWNKGKPHPAARNLPQAFKKGQVAWNYNRSPLSCATCGKTFFVQAARVSIAKYCSIGCKAKKQQGQRPWNWKTGDATNEARTIRDSREYRTWRKHVFQRDDYTCQACGQRGGKLNADHELPFAHYPDLRFEVLNGRTLCVPCHRKTPTWGAKSKVDYEHLIT